MGDFCKKKKEEEEEEEEEKDETIVLTHDLISISKGP